MAYLTVILLQTLNGPPAAFAGNGLKAKGFWKNRKQLYRWILIGMKEQAGPVVRFGVGMTSPG
jgi:hypothetical protein